MHAPMSTVKFSLAMMQRRSTISDSNATTNAVDQFGSVADMVAEQSCTSSV